MFEEEPTDAQLVIARVQRTHLAVAIVYIKPIVRISHVVVALRLLVRSVGSHTSSIISAKSFGESNDTPGRYSKCRRYRDLKTEY